MEDVIMDLYKKIIANTSGEDVAQQLTLGLDKLIDGLYKDIIDIQNTAVASIAFALLSVFILLEFMKISMKVEGAGGAPMLGFEMIIKAFIKFIICYIVIINVQVILDGIIGLTSHLTQQILTVGNDGGALDSDGAISKRLQQVLDKAKWWSKLVLIIAFFMVWLVSIATGIFLKLTIYLRALELYAYSAIAPISVSALPNEEFSSISKGFFKNYAATALHASCIALMLVMYPRILSQLIVERGDAFGILMGILLYIVLITLGISKTKGWAKLIVGA